MSDKIAESQGGVQATATRSPLLWQGGVAPTLTLQQDESPAFDMNLWGQGGQSSVTAHPGGLVVPVVRR